MCYSWCEEVKPGTHVPGYRTDEGGWGGGGEWGGSLPANAATVFSVLRVAAGTVHGRRGDSKLLSVICIVRASR